MVLNLSVAHAAIAGILKDVSYTEYDDYVRVVIDVSTTVRFYKREIGNPHRVYIDIKDTNIGSFKNKIIDVGNLILTRIRTAQFAPNTVRVVLDLENVAEVKVSTPLSLKSIVVDIYDIKKDRTQQKLQSSAEPSEKNDKKKEAEEKSGDDERLPAKDALTEKDKIENKTHEDVNEKRNSGEEKNGKKVKKEISEKNDTPNTVVKTERPSHAEVKTSDATIYNNGDDMNSLEEQLSGVLSEKQDDAFFLNKTVEKPLTLRESFIEALSRNLTIKSSKITPISAALDISSAKAAFYPTFTQGYSLSGDPVSKTSAMLIPTGISLPLIIGGSMGLSLSNTKNLTDDSAATYQSTVAATLTVPLLAGAGYSINRAPIIIAELTETNSKLALREQVEATLVNINSAYWNLRLAREGLMIQVDALKEARRLHNKTLELIKEGEIAELDKYQTEASISNREVQLISAIKTLRDSQSTLLNLLNRDLSENLNPIDLPVFNRIDSQYQKSVDIALENRTDYLQALQNMKINETNLKLAKNNALPSLSLSLGYNTGSTSNPGGFERSLDHLSEDRSWIAAMSLSIPIPNTLKENSYYKSKLTLEQAKINLEKLKEDIKMAIRQSILGLNTARKQVEAARKTMELNQIKLNAEKAKLEEGLSDLFTVISFQNELVTSKLAEAGAVVDYQTAVITLKKNEGILLSYLDIRFQDGSIDNYYTSEK
ncbi:MAG: TolC family protein [Nitrospirae bacterium]|nr:TolC family protein [Nitrospirota bacterium]